MTSGNNQMRVLVTGASGYVAINAVEQLLKQGYKVRGTVRSVKNEKKIQPIQDVCPEAKENLELVEADLTDADCWQNIVRDCKYVLHIASPIILNVASLTDEDVMIRPAVDGTLNILRACAATHGGVERVVLTSSVAAVIYGHTSKEEQGRTFTEEDWTDPTGRDVDTYIKSKYLAEKAAWEFVNNLRGDEKFELSVINPGFILGPLLHNTEGASAESIRRMLTGGMPMLPKLQFPVVDVRDVALAHIRAFQIKEAGGKRFLLANTPVWFREIAGSLSEEFTPQGYKLPCTEAPTGLLKVVSWFDTSIKSAIPRCDFTFNVDNTQMRKVLNIDPIPLKRSVVDMAYSMIERGLIKKTPGYTGPTTVRF